jgi:ABC-type transport system involved in multi-copper enzyme maturation permease subunit
MKEGRTTLLSVRLLIITSILALAVLAATYSIAPGLGGGAGVPSRIVHTFTYFPELNHSRPALALFVTSVGGSPVEGLSVELVNVSETGRFSPPTLEVLEATPTDASGWVRFENLTTRYPDRQLATRLADEPDNLYGYVFTFTGTEPFPPEPLENFGMLGLRTVALGGRQDRQILSLVFIDTRGAFIEGASVYIWRIPDVFNGPFFEEGPPGGWEPYLNGTTDTVGHYFRPDPLGSGGYLVRAEKGELNDTRDLWFFGGPNPFTEGPDGILAFSGLLFLPLILPIMAMVLAYGAITRERAEGSLDLLLSKPVSRIGVGLGKLTGVFGSMALPVVAVLLVAAALIWLTVGTPPTGSFLASFVGVALFLLLAYTLLFLAVSANVRNLGTALLVSILLFLLFAFFWGPISFIVPSLFAPPGSVRWLEISVVFSLGNPTAVYQQLLALSLPALLGGLFSPFGGIPQELPLWWTASAGAIWIAVPLALFLWAMKYRVSEA